MIFNSLLSFLLLISIIFYVAFVRFLFLYNKHKSVKVKREKGNLSKVYNGVCFFGAILTNVSFDNGIRDLDLSEELRKVNKRIAKKRLSKLSEHEIKLAKKICFDKYCLLWTANRIALGIVISIFIYKNSNAVAIESVLWGIFFSNLLLYFWANLLIKGRFNLPAEIELQRVFIASKWKFVVVLFLVAIGASILQWSGVLYFIR